MNNILPVTTQNIELRRLSYLSRYMSMLTLILMVVMLLINIICWLFPDFGAERLGFSFSISMILSLQIDVASLPWWQKLGGMIISSLPLLALVAAAFNLYRLFSLYARQIYFSEKSAIFLRQVGRCAMWWVVLGLVCEPILSYWLTMNAPIGEKQIVLSFDSNDVLALFLAACFWIFARILGKASELHHENQSFV